MKIGLLADIHSNVHALKAVLKSARTKKVRKLLCCGDYVGYYYEPSGVMESLNEWDWNGVSGNHEGMLKDWLIGHRINDIKLKYGHGIAHAVEKLTHDQVTGLCEMPSQKRLNIKNYNVILCHGSPWGRDVYIYPDSSQKTLNKLFEYNFDILVYGHTHYPAFWKEKNKIIVNPGSIGQPRDNKPGASWAIWDTTSNEVNFFREKYDADPVIEMCRKYDPKINYLTDVLVRE